MAENPRDYIRAAQAAEQRGDKAGAADLLHSAAAVYARSGNLHRALQLLRHARTLDQSREDIADAVRRLERQSEEETESPPTSVEQSEERAEELESVPSSPEELAERQRLIEEALRAVESNLGGPGDEDGPRQWEVEELAPEELPRLLDQAVRSISELPRARNEWSLEEVDVALSLTPVPEEPTAEESAIPGAPAGREHLFERGPTRADPALAAWCSFCCRPHTEVGELVAGPSGSYICRACVGESEGLLGDVKAVPRLVREPAAPAREKPGALELIGQDEARALLETALEAGVRRLLLLGSEGVGKTTWLHSLQGQGRGMLVTVDALAQASATEMLLVEDVDRLSPEAQAVLTAFLARQPERTVLMTARGTLEAPGLELRNSKARLPLHTTAALAEAVGGALPVALLEQVQLAVALRAPTKKEFMEIARWRLALRTPAVSVTNDVLATLAAEAARSSRAGHELQALLSRVPAGTWKLDAAKKKKPVRRSRRKGRP
jgi:hypothetical protein